MSKKRIKLILNPNADMGNAWKRASDLRHIANGKNEISWAGTVFPTHAKELAKQAAEEGYDLVIAVGGDGTAHEVINGLMETPAEKRPRFGIVPLGSGNDYAANLGLPRSPEKALDTILNGKPKKFDLAMIEDENGRKEYWDNTTNIGFGGSVNYYSHKLPIIRGFLMYLIAVLQTIFSKYIVMKCKITTDQAEWEEESIMIALNNGPREGGGFHTGPHAVMDDGLLNYTIAKRISRLKMLMLLPAFMNGTQEKDKAVYMGTFKSMEIISDAPLYLHADGEQFAGFNHNIHRLKIEIVPQALEVIVPKEAL